MVALDEQGLLTLVNCILQRIHEVDAKPVKGVDYFTQDDINEILSAIPSASESTAGIIKLLTSYSSTNTSKAATPKAVKDAYDASVAHADGLTAAEVGAHPNTWMPTAVDVGAVPTNRTVNGKPLSSNVTLTASDVGALPASTILQPIIRIYQCRVPKGLIPDLGYGFKLTADNTTFLSGTAPSPFGNANQFIPLVVGQSSSLTHSTTIYRHVNDWYIKTNVDQAYTINFYCLS